LLAKVPTWLLGALTLFNISAFVFLILAPYYVFLGKEQYIPKSNPDLGYFMPKTAEAWFFLVLALVFFALFWLTFALFYRRIRGKGYSWVTPWKVCMPIHLQRVMKIGKKTIRVKYGLQVLGPVCLEEVVESFLKRSQEE
jgi:uncharacterized membrane protein YhaH (DUF805 family)